MRAPLSWLRDYAPLDADVDVLVSTLSELGLVVDGVEHVGAGLEDVVVARVLDIRSHPRADRVRLVDVDAGGPEPVQVVCGAWNFEKDDLVPLAPVGAVLPGDFRISLRTIKGEASNGMLCSARELEIPEPAGADDGLLILPAGIAPPGTPLGDALDLHPDVVFDLDITPNRSDALCMAGVARDLAAALGEEWRLPDSPVVVPVDESLGRAPIALEAPDLCPRFTGTILEGVPSGPTPAWLARRLTAAGMRPISAVVDISNYVMLDLGQPNHAYDLERLGGGGILVRRGRPGETLETLDGVERTLVADDCVICDAEGVAVGVAGVMGGASAEITATTRRVLLEAAWFSPMAIARTGKRLGLHSEARVRFERGVDPELASLAVDRFIGLLASLEGGAALKRGPMLDRHDAAHLPVAPVVAVRTARVNALLGTAIPTAEVDRLLAPIGFARVEGSETEQSFQVPSWRLECTREIDLIEEVARMWGYRKIVRTVPARAPQGSTGLSRSQRERRHIREAMWGAGFDEAWTTTFLAPGDLERAGLDGAAVEVENPLDISESRLRTALLPGLLKAVKFNVDRQAEDVCLFEIGRVFDPPAPGAALATPEESEHLAVIVAPSAPAQTSDRAVAAAVRAWEWLVQALRLADPSLVPEAVPGLHPGRAAWLRAGSGRTLGSVGEVDSEVVASYGLTGRIGYLAVSLDGLLDEPRRPRRARDVSRFPAADIDLAFVVPNEVAAASVRDVLAHSDPELIESVTLFDVYRGPQSGEGRRSLAFRLRYRAPDRTLGEAELNAVRQAAISAATVQLEIELRG